MHTRRPGRAVWPHDAGTGPFQITTHNESVSFPVSPAIGPSPRFKEFVISIQSNVATQQLTFGFDPTDPRYAKVAELIEPALLSDTIVGRSTLCRFSHVPSIPWSYNLETIANA
ncbi:MAG: hypothetical protein M3083_17610 [Actinomycetota bacterium]|nr:hypothetical protein [Actinomycetota bacterium]MDQ6948184.1 hypothetical protein [Actinomycetota bacterium]